MENNQKDIYAECRHIKRTKPDMTIDQKTAKAIGQEYRVLPSFERMLHEKKNIKHNSLETNELLKCRWEQYKKHIAEKVFTPFRFPNIRDLHFHTNTVRYLPKETVINQPDHKMKLRPGPGVDFQGQIPIPLELQMRRSTSIQNGGKKTDGRLSKKQESAIEASKEMSDKRN